MKKLTTGALLAALSLAGVSIAQAQPTTPFTPGDVLVGFTSSSSSGDLIINLGNVAALLTAAHESVGGTINLNAAGYTGFTAGGLSTQARDEQPPRRQQRPLGRSGGQIHECQ